MALMIWTWRRGVGILTIKTRRIEVPLADLIKSLEKRPPHIVKGTAVFLTSDPSFVPTALLHNLKHNKVLHEHNVILTIETAQTPRVDLADRVLMETISDKFATVRLRFGFMESPNVPKALVIARKLGWQFDIMATSFFVSRRSLKPSARSTIPRAPSLRCPDRQRPARLMRWTWRTYADNCSPAARSKSPQPADTTCC